MAHHSRIRIWQFIHKWTSLVCTLFLLMLCLTGLPLIFSDEIEDWLDDHKPPAATAAGTPAAKLDAMAAIGRQRHPGQVLRYLYWDMDEPRVLIGVAPSPTTPVEAITRLAFDAHTGELLDERLDGWHLMRVILRLHKDLLVELPGMLFLGAMGLLFAAAIVSGIVLYAPFMKRLAFGAVRRDRTPRIRWLDLHNLLGITLAGWTLVVGVTGSLNTLATPLFQMWQRQEVPRLLTPFQGKPMPERLASIDAGVATVRAALPDRTVTSVVFPSPRTSPRHYVVWTKGASPVTSRLFTPVLIDAEDGRLTLTSPLPWYLRAVQLSRPLHFGDYGGLPLKILWAALDGATIIVLGSGVYLWLARRRTPNDGRLTDAAGTDLPPATLPSQAAE